VYKIKKSRDKNGERNTICFSEKAYAQFFSLPQSQQSPPSQIANLKPSSISIGVMISTDISELSSEISSLHLQAKL